MKPKKKEREKVKQTVSTREYAMSMYDQIYNNIQIICVLLQSTY